MWCAGLRLLIHTISCSYINYIYIHPCYTSMVVSVIDVYFCGGVFVGGYEGQMDEHWF